MSHHASTITLPTHWACYLINGDASGLNDGEEQLIAEHLNRELPEDASIVDVVEGSERFTWSFRLYGGDASGGDVADYTVLSPSARATVQRAGADDAPDMVTQPVQQQQGRDGRAESSPLNDGRRHSTRADGAPRNGWFDARCISAKGAPYLTEGQVYRLREARNGWLETEGGDRMAAFRFEPIEPASA